MKLRFLLLSFGISFLSLAQGVHYTLRMSKPQNHYFEVEMLVSDVKENSFDIKMPVWAPGSYLVREFAKNVNMVKAWDEKGKALEVKKRNKNTWEVVKGSAQKVKINYEVYAFELSVRTSFLDLTHGFVSGSGVFMYVDKLREKSGTLSVIPYETFKKVSTAMPVAGERMSSDKGFEFSFMNYDQLVDCPIEIGNHETFDFTAEGVKHNVAIYGPGNYDIPTLKKDMATIVSTATKVFGENPNKDYTFIIHNVVDGQGGLEHTNSTTLSVNRWTYQGAEYIGFLSLVAHEYFHLWNVKRIRPVQLGPFNYDEENYTSLLWVMEGFTSYYDELLLRRAGFYTQEQMLQKINSSVNYVEGSEGSRVQPVAHASFDAWIKAYRPNENSANTTMTYYTRGAMIAAMLDAKIVTKFKGKKSLDDFLQKLYKDFYKKLNRGFSEEEFEKALTDFMGEDMKPFLDAYVYGTQVPDFKAVFGPLGVKTEYTGTKKANFGATFSNGIVKSVRSNSSAENAGLSVNDEIIGVNGYRVSGAEVDATLGSYDDGDVVSILVAREDILLELTAKIGSYERPSYRMSVEKPNDLLNYWLR
ncbi:MAG: peptidase domain protein [Crocinitomicaceae bacterium]|jgi:predicted metalloprotease with PDZ domain|nr:peptidase domain protein [Crocinitomicaceae bacterium]